jgi:hypothetical protein
VSDSRLILGREASRMPCEMDRALRIEESLAQAEFPMGTFEVSEEDSFKPTCCITEEIYLRRVVQRLVSGLNSDFISVGGVYQTALRYLGEAAELDSEINPMPRVVWAAKKAILELNRVSIGNLVTVGEIACLNDRSQVQVAWDFIRNTHTYTPLPGWNEQQADRANAKIEAGDVPIVPRDVRAIRGLRPIQVAPGSYQDPESQVLLKSEIVADIARLPFSACYFANEIIAKSAKQRARVLVMNCGALTTAQTILTLNGRLKVDVYNSRLTPENRPVSQRYDSVLLGLDSPRINQFLQMCHHNYDATHLVRDFEQLPLLMPDSRATNDKTLFDETMSLLEPGGTLLIALSTNALGTLHLMSERARASKCKPLGSGLLTGSHSLIEDAVIVSHGHSAQSTLALVPKPEHRILIGWRKS